MNNLGYACYNMNLGQSAYEIDSEAWRFGLIHPRARTRECQYKWRDAYVKLKEQLGGWRVTHLAVEWPTFFDSTRGRIAAMKGYTIDLAGMTGYLAGRFGLPPDYITLWKPEQWKGSVPKHVTAQKFIRLFGPGADYVVRNYADDTVDAIMIAEFWLTLYNREKFIWQRRHERQQTTSA